MIRKLVAVGAAVLITAGAGLTASQAMARDAAPHATATHVAARTVIPNQGYYEGYDHQHNLVKLQFGGNEITHFSVNGQSFGNAHVSSDSWGERCNGGWCFKGRWVSSTQVEGSWRHGSSSEWHPWSVLFAKSYFRGWFSGYDHNRNEIKVHWNGTHINHFTVNGYGDFPSTQVDHHGYWQEVCSRDWCYRGHFDGDYMVVGEWRTPGSTWYPWDAYAYSS